MMAETEGFDINSLPKNVQEDLERFQKATADSFVKFCEKCYRAGFQIKGEEFIKLIMERISQIFDRVRDEALDEDERNQAKAKKPEGKSLAEFIEASKKLITAVTDPTSAKTDKREIIDLMQQLYASDVFETGGKDSSGDGGVNVGSRAVEEESLIVSIEMTSSNSGSGAKNKQIGQSKAMKRAIKRGKKTKMTITTLVERQSSTDGVNQQVTITKNKSGTVSISGISIQTKEKASEAHQSGANAAAEASGKTDGVLSPLVNSEETSSPVCSEISDTVKYRCAHCQDVRHYIESFNAPKDVYMHWLSVHTVDPSNVKPFQYLVIEYATCFHCQTIGTYCELIKHHKDCHGIEPFVIVNQKDAQKCALCSYSGPGLIEHFSAMHKLILKTLSVRNLRSGLLYRQLNDTILTELLASKVHRKLKCGNCYSIFATDAELRSHHQKCHRSIKFVSYEFYDSNFHLICHCCHGKVDKGAYLNHVEARAYQFNCSNCKFQTKDMLALVTHDKQSHGVMNSFEYRCMQFKNRLIRNYLKTKVVFGNGLVLTKQNLLNTKYDDSKQFDVFIEALIKIKKERRSRQAALN